jgi:hypothetical protein
MTPEGRLASTIELNGQIIHFISPSVKAVEAIEFEGDGRIEKTLRELESGRLCPLPKEEIGQDSGLSTSPVNSPEVAMRSPGHLHSSRDH